MSRCFRLLITLLLVAVPSLVFAQERELKVRGDQARMLKEGFWIYNDLAKGLEQAKATGKPLLVVFRCIPCEACAQLDEDVLENNPSVRKWLSQFVPVRIVHANHMDLNKFQFDYDQSWAAFVLHADGTIIGRYGTRSHQTESADDVSLDGFLESLSVALKLHRDFDQVRDRLAAKTGVAAPVAHPEDYPTLKTKYGPALDYEGKVVQSCIHCHQVGEATREWYRNRGQAVPEELVFPYPHPKILGLVMDPGRARTVKSVTPDSPAAAAGLQAGDEIVAFGGQPIISTADMQWVLHHAGEKRELGIEVQRGGQAKALSLNLPEGWREQGDITWRATSWALRRMLTGGLRLEALTKEERQALELAPDAIGLRVKHVGQFNEHAAAKRAGFKVDDVLVKVGSLERPATETQLFAALINAYRPGDKVPVELLRGDKRLTLQLPIQP